MAIYMDLTKTHEWLRDSMIIGSARTCQELLKILRDITDIVVVKLLSDDGVLSLRMIDIDSMEETGEEVVPMKGDVLFTPEFQIRNQQVPIFHPTVGRLREKGVGRVAILYDLLPIEYPQYFLQDTVKGMPDYLGNLLKNYEKIICISRTVADSLYKFIKAGMLEPYCTTIDIRRMNSPEIHDNAYHFFLNSTDQRIQLFLRGSNHNAIKGWEFIINNQRIDKWNKSSEKGLFIAEIDAQQLNQDGLQRIEIIRNGISYGEDTLLYSIQVVGMETSLIPVHRIIKHSIEISYAYLGATRLHEDRDNPDEGAISFFKGEDRNVFLMVGTIEPRKGYEIVLKVFEMLWDEGFTGKLCLIGRGWWGMAAFLEHLKSHPELGKKLIHLNSANDSTLCYAYQHATALIQASADEGFGLPLIEAGHYDLPIICTDIPVFHEVAGNAAAYFHRDKPGELADLVRHFKEKKADGSIPDSRGIHSYTWDECARKCLNIIKGIEKPLYTVKPLRPQISTLNHYDLFPIDHGGRIYIRDFYKALSKWFDIKILFFTDNPYYEDEVRLNSHISAYPIRVSDKLLKKREVMYKRYGMNGSTFEDPSPAIMQWYHDDDEVIEKVRELTKDSLIVLAEHCYTWRIIKKACPEKHLWYRSHNVEYDFVSSLYRTIGSPKQVLSLVKSVEEDCIRNAERILTISNEDRERFSALYHLDNETTEKISTLGCGYDSGSLDPVFPAERISEDPHYRFCGFFIASTMQATDAVRDCISIARECPEIKVIIAGHASRGFMDKDNPSNAEVLGYISEEDKRYYLTHCDFALNLVDVGSGVNVKMFEYFAYGIPVITTGHGGRGIELRDGLNCIITRKGSFTADIRRFCAMAIEERNRIAQNASTLLHQKYEWSGMGKKVAEEISKRYRIDMYAHEISDEELRLVMPERLSKISVPKSYYIRCAGNYGRMVLEKLREIGWKDPIAFVDNDDKKAGKAIEGVPVVSVEEYLRDERDESLIIAIKDGLIELAGEMIHMGIRVEQLILAFDPEKLLNLYNMSGAVPSYCSAYSIRKRILNHARGMGRRQ